MKPAGQKAVSQVCPNCQRAHDISVYVSGQRVLCDCGIRFEVRRTDVSMAPPTMPSAGRPPPAPLEARAGPVTLSSSLLKSEPPSSSSGPELDRTVAPSRNSGQSPADPGTVAAAAVPPVIAGYELNQVLGRGGMGEVWRARQVSLGRTVAVKILPPRLASDPEFVARFDKEATALASLSHPNITQIIDRGVSGDHYYFVMEYVAGKSLRDVINAGRPPPAEALRIAVQICRAIDHAHELQIIHRDLKPENILLDLKGHVKVADFGLAGMRGSAQNIELTATSVAMGTVNYMAPEQRRDAKHVDHRADIYSLGVMLYELLTGELPIGRFKLPSERVRGLSPQLDDVVSQLLETEPDARPARAALVAERLEPLIAQTSSQVLESYRDTSPRPPSAAGTGPSLPPARTGLKVGAGVLAGMAALALLLKLWPASTPVEPPVQARAPEWYRDTEDDLHSKVVEKDDAFTLDFSPGGVDDEELNGHAGVWQLKDGALTAVQYGKATDAEHARLVPRAYVAHRYYSADDFTADVDVAATELPAEFPPLPAATARYAELAFRIKDLQVSVFAIPDSGMRLSWRYFLRNGTEVLGDSADDVENLHADEVKMPSGRPFHLRLQLKKTRTGDVSAEAWVDGQSFARKTLTGLAGQVGKVALGCKDLSCRFDTLAVSGKAADQPKLRGSP